MRNIHNPYEAKALEVQEAISREPILRIRTQQRAKEYLKLNVSNGNWGNLIIGKKIVFSKTLNRNVFIIEYKERWQEKNNIILIKKAE